MKKKFLNRSLAVLLGTAMVMNFSNVGVSSAESVEESKNIERVDTYIVQTVDESKRDVLDEKYESADSISTLSEDSMQEANFTTLELSGREAEQLERDKKVVLVEPDIEVKGSDCDSLDKSDAVSESEDEEWNYQAIHVDDVKKEKSDKDKVKVALIDSGVDMFNDIEVKDYINLIPGEEDVMPLFWDISGHGTSIAGIIAAKDNDTGITGIAPEVELYSARVLDENKSAPVSRIIEAIYWAIEKDVDIISLSFGTGTKSEALENAIKDAYNHGILIIAAAGNHGEVEYPAAMKEVMAVGGTDTDGSVCDYSGKGEEVEIVAPAEKIKATGGFDGTVVVNGTSMAVPHVVGVAAKLWEKDRTKSADFIRQLMNASANSNCGDEKECGNGLIDYEQAVKIYDDFEKNYRKWKTLEQNEVSIEENNSPIPVFTDVNCVNGSWHCEGDKSHTALANDALQKNGYKGINNTYVISMVKTGAVYPDKEKNGFYGMAKHPCAHGYFKKTTGTADCNYVDSYIKCTKLAKQMRDGKTFSKPKEYNANDATKEFQKMFATVNLSGLNSSAYYKAAFGYGVAIHTATDVFAHCVWSKQYGRLFHGKEANANDYADNANKVPERYDVAKDVAINILQHFKDNTVGTANDFCNSLHYNDNVFKLYNFTEYLNAVGAKDLANKMTNNSKTY